MVGWILKKILGSKNQRELKRLMPIVRQINEFDEQFKSLSDDELRVKTAAWKEEIANIPELENQWKKLDEILPEAFAVVKNAARRLKDQQHTFTVCDQPMTWDMVHFDVQLLGGIVLHRGRIAEMASGEGKTLVATSPLYLNARTALIISGPATISTHQYDKWKPLIEQLVRKQNMLCNRVASEAIEKFEQGDVEIGGRLMFKVKLGQPRNKQLLRMMEDPDKRRAIDKAELSFYQDTRKEELFQLKEELFFTIDEKSNEADLSEQGRIFVNPDDPNAFVLPDLINEFTEIDLDPTLPDDEKDKKKSERQQYCDAQAERIHNISQLLKAYCLFEKDVQYVLEDNKVVIVDEFTGRKMPGRRWSDGLHQAVEAKEGVQIDRETQTLATITIQNYFRLYQKLAGMTGTAETEAAEFHDIYKLDVNMIPTNRPIRRTDNNDRIYKTRREKYNAVIKEIKDAHAKSQPVLVGTVSVEASELLSRMLKREKIPHNVLNAKFHMQEAEIVARAGQPGTVTISTNMAGRGTDIKLGPGVIDLGGLMVVGTERHEARRIDRQLRGRCARQGDPGASRFYVSFEDDLMRNFGAADRMTKIMERFGLEEGQELEHRWLNKSVETAQKRVEQRYYMIRKRTLDFDDVMNNQC